MATDTLVSIGLAARQCGVSRERLGQLIDKKKIPVVRDSVGRRFLEQAVLDRLLCERRAQGLEAPWPRVKSTHDSA
jgi:hypothetical protein